MKRRSTRIAIAAALGLTLIGPAAAETQGSDPEGQTPVFSSPT